MKKIDLTGQRFGRLTVIEQTFVNGVKKCVCLCDCGNKTVVHSGSLTSGASRSCGCLQRELTSQRSIVDLSGLRFGKLVVIERISKIGDEVRYLCKCDCGNNKIVNATDLRRGRTKSCGCLYQERMKEGWARDLSGRKFGRLTVMEKISETGKPKKYRCRCDCGNFVEVFEESLTTGNTQSCGCLQKERAKESNTTHGLGKNRLYVIWTGMKQRCNNPKATSFPRYGARGIRVCKEWESDFKAFFDWAVENGYQDDLSIDRVDSNGDYCPDNCRWASSSEQARNRRSNFYVQYKGNRLVLKDFAERIGKNPDYIRRKLKQGLSLNEIIGEKNPANGAEGWAESGLADTPWN